MKDKNTIIVNLYGGPGSGKSTGAAYIFSQLKLEGIDCELVTEFAKDKVWENNSTTLNCQMYVTGKQAFRISRVFGKVDVIITDSPIMLGAIYAEENRKHLKNACIEEANQYICNELNFFINRVKEYNPNGRNQTECEAKEIDNKIHNLLNENFRNAIEVNGNIKGYNDIVKYIKIRLETANNI